MMGRSGRASAKEMETEDVSSRKRRAQWRERKEKNELISWKKVE